MSTVETEFVRGALYRPRGTEDMYLACDVWGSRWGEHRIVLFKLNGPDGGCPYNPDRAFPENFERQPPFDVRRVDPRALIYGAMIRVRTPPEQGGDMVAGSYQITALEDTFATQELAEAFGRGVERVTTKLGVTDLFFGYATTPTGAVDHALNRALAAAASHH